MALDIQQERTYVHALVDQLAPAKLRAVRSVLEVMVDVDEVDEEVTEEDRRRVREGQAQFASGKGIPMEEVLAEFGLKLEDFPVNG